MTLHMPEYQSKMIYFNNNFILAILSYLLVSQTGHSHFLRVDSQICENATDGHPCPRYLANKFKMPKFSKGHNSKKN